MTNDALNLDACPVCGGRERLEHLISWTVPAVCNVLYDSREEAVSAPTGRMNLVFCGGCGHLYNASFDAEDIRYGASYENSLHFSRRFQSYAEALADELVSKHGINGKTVVEIGCGKGEFLSLLCHKGNNRGIGFDPSYQSGREGVDAEAVTVIRDYYSEKYADISADLISCRHVLEHVPNPVDFLASVRRSVGDRPAAVIYFEVPDGHYMLREMAVWDLIYEHYSYFTPASLEWAFRRAGFEVLVVQSGFGGQFLQLLARPGTAIGEDAAPPAPDADLKRLAQAFGKRLEAKVTGWRQRLREQQQAGRRVAVWGAGSKGVSFTNLAEPAVAIDCLVDVNPHKMGKHIPITGHPVVSPDQLGERMPDTVLLMNGNYAEEVGESLNRLGLDADLLVEHEWRDSHDSDGSS